MKNKHLLLLAALYSMVLVQSCVTVRRIDKKDSRNNQFSTQLQNWMAIKHPQKIDTTAKIISSDTTITESDSVFYNLLYQPTIPADTISKYFLYSWDQYKIEEKDGSFFITGRNKAPSMAEYVPSIIKNTDDTVLWKPLYVIHDTVVKNILRTKIITIHDTVTNTVVNSTELNALKTYLQVSRDSTNKYILKYTQQQSTSRARLIWIIVLCLILAVGIYFTIKKGIL